MAQGSQHKELLRRRRRRGAWKAWMRAALSPRAGYGRGEEQKETKGEDGGGCRKGKELRREDWAVIPGNNRYSLIRAVFFWVKCWRCCIVSPLWSTWFPLTGFFFLYAHLWLDLGNKHATNLPSASFPAILTVSQQWVKPSFPSLTFRFFILRLWKRPH